MRWCTPSRWWSALLLATPLTAVVAQTEVTLPWRTSHFPYFTMSPGDGVEGIFRVLHFRQAEPEDRVTLRDAVALEGGLSTRGSWRVDARGDFPRIGTGWRLVAEAGVRQRAHFGDPDGDDRWRERGVAVEATRQLGGPVHLAMRGGIRQVDLRIACGAAESAYPGAEAVGRCDAAAPGVTETDQVGRAALVFDWRDREFETRRGALVELGGILGQAAGASYQGAHAVARGWLAVGETTRLTARLGARALSPRAGIAAREELLLWEQRVSAPAGPRTQRGLAVGEQPGRGLLLAGAEVRQEIWRFRGVAAISLIAFTDGVRVFQDPSPLVDPLPGAPIPSGRLRLTGSGWDWSVGGGVAIRVLRSAQLNLTGASHPGGGVTWYLTSGWAW